MISNQRPGEKRKKRYRREFNHQKNEQTTDMPNVSGPETAAMLNHSEQTPNVTNASIPECHPVTVAEQHFQVV